MPNWTGWNESAARQTSPHGGWNPVNAIRASVTPDSSLSGFTPINGPAASLHPSQPSVTPDDDQTGVDAAKTATSREAARKPTVASSYLDRSISPTVLHGVGTKKTAAAEGKKRARKAHSEADARSKRSKSGNVASTMSLTKSGASATLMPDDECIFDLDSDFLSSTDMDTFHSTSNHKGNPQQHEPVLQDAGVHGDTDTSETRPVAVYSQPTSMEKIQHHQTQTTMGSLREKTHNDSAACKQWVARAAQSKYDQQMPAGTIAGVDLAPTANTRILRPRKANAANLGTTLKGKPAQPSQLATPANSDPPTQSIHLKEFATQRAKGIRISRSKSDEDFAVLGDEDEADLIDLTENLEALVRPTAPVHKVPTRDWKQNMRDVDEHEDYGGALFSQAERELLGSLKQVKASQKPIVRTAFPQPVLDRSSVFGASNATVLQTCFRVGEALNTGCQAVRNNKNVVLELYARVTASSRDSKPSRKQHFVIKDLYHDNPPHLNGTFELWDQSALWELDSKPFLAAGATGIMCRMIARMKRDGAAWRLEILNVWQASWEDIEHVAGIYARADQGQI